MERSNVPQDDAKILEGKFKVIKYAVDEKGDYTTVPTVGWEAENVVLGQAWEEINRNVEAAKQRVLEGKSSPILYHMAKQMMDIGMVAGYTGYMPLMVRLHLIPWFFRRLSDKSLDKYAKAFRISRKELLEI